MDLLIQNYMEARGAQASASLACPRVKLIPVVGITNSIDMSLSELREMVRDREAWRAAGHGVAKLNAAQ